MEQTSHLQTSAVVRHWHVIDAAGIPLGRLATMAAHLLMGKGKTSFNRHSDQGDGVVIENAEKVVLTGKKAQQKIEFRASGHQGGQRYIAYEKFMTDRPEHAVELAVTGMLPKNRLRSRFMRRLKVFRGADVPMSYKSASRVDVSTRKMQRGGPHVLKFPALVKG